MATAPDGQPLPTEGDTGALADRAAREQERRETRADRIGLALFIGAICLVFVLLVVTGYAARAGWAGLSRLFQ